ncbi:hypothetical protein WBP07_03230 [Novosphingobium sp. BL-8A]|uniref:hypothetical protein n=1 Tax=Novosphingobium sp. BL-8A TaxID=3127639 RepID=UPI003756736E
MEERIVETDRAPEAPVHTTTVIRERGSGGGAGIIMALALLIAVIGGIYLFSRQSASESARDNAVANAAQDVGDAANKVGDAAKDAADNLNHKD